MQYMMQAMQNHAVPHYVWFNNHAELLRFVDIGLANNMQEMFVLFYFSSSAMT